MQVVYLIPVQLSKIYQIPEFALADSGREECGLPDSFLLVQEIPVLKAGGLANSCLPEYGLVES